MALLPIPAAAARLLKTERMILEPICVAHAAEILPVLRDAVLYRFIPHEPVDLPALQKRFALWEKNQAPDGSEIWLNWAARLRQTGECLGHFQAGIKENLEVSIAYMIGVAYQRQGYALEGLRTLTAFLFGSFPIPKIQAWIDTRNEASLRLVERLGMKRVGHIPNADSFKGATSDEFVYELSSPEEKS